MKRLEPNLLLAVTTGFALVLVTVTASVYGAGEPLRNLLLAVSCSGGFVLLNPMLLRTMKSPVRPPLIHSGSRGMTAWSSLFPMVVILCAAVPVFWPGPDYGLLIIIAAVWFGVTVESALRARRA
ncbi:hypothetical protein [Brevundimonas sp.]|uniref:hypothetical protein n=1 Tax=Brevundimonas sp. TaxID=1871086 RepID=UPI003F729E92